MGRQIVYYSVCGSPITKGWEPLIYVDLFVNKPYINKKFWICTYISYDTEFLLIQYKVIIRSQQRFLRLEERVVLDVTRARGGDGERLVGDGAVGLDGQHVMHGVRLFANCSTRIDPLWTAIQTRSFWKKKLDKKMKKIFIFSFSRLVKVLVILSGVCIKTRFTLWIQEVRSLPDGFRTEMPD